jgi:hypothetical protein
MRHSVQHSRFTGEQLVFIAAQGEAETVEKKLHRRTVGALSRPSMVKRVSLHLICMLRRPKTAGWHWQGIVREVRDTVGRKTQVRI